jgi:hypothetical protein
MDIPFIARHRSVPDIITVTFSAAYGDISSDKLGKYIFSAPDIVHSCSAGAALLPDVKLTAVSAEDITYPAAADSSDSNGFSHTALRTGRKLTVIQSVRTKITFEYALTV